MIIMNNYLKNQIYLSLKFFTSKTERSYEFIENLHTLKSKILNFKLKTLL